MAFPATVNNLTTSINATDVLGLTGGGIGIASVLSAITTDVNALTVKTGADSSAVTTSIDYLLKNTASVDPGHKHTAATGASDKTFPSGTIVGTTDSQTLTNKTLTDPILNGLIQAYTTDTDGATITFDLSASNLHTVVLAGNRTLAVSNGATGKPFMVRLVQDATGSRTVTWFTTIKWAGGSAPTLTTTANKADTFGFLTTGAGTYDGYIIGQNV